MRPSVILRAAAHEREFRRVAIASFLGQLLLAAAIVVGLCAFGGCGTFFDPNCWGGSPSEIPSYCHRAYHVDGGSNPADLPPLNDNNVIDINARLATDAGR